ncbi:MAG TPA: alpha/beta hydrolase [Stellaceae bacterium]|nr:alpha/beta hydrolase [Stellaceae bacterium]
MALSEIDAIRSLLTSKARPVGWIERRQRIDEVGSTWPVADDVKLTAITIGRVPAEWSVVRGGDSSRVLMFFHGGGYCSGSIVSHRRMVTEAGRAAGTRTLAVEYRLAPEHPFPAALEDAEAAWRFLREQGIAASRIAIGGDSAGGGLTAALVNRLRGAHEPLPACTWLVSPWVDLTMSGSTLVSKDAVDPLIHKDYLEELAKAYLPAGMDRRNPQVSPLYADLAGFPPTLVQVGSSETLLDDATRFAARLGAADVPVALEVWPRMIHAWHLWNARLKPARLALENAGAFMRHHLAARTEPAEDEVPDRESR